MRSIKRDLIFLSILSVSILAFALSWGGPFMSGSYAFAQDQAQPPQQQQQQDQAKSKTFIGTIVRNGEQYVLRDSSGQTYKLDKADSAQQFEGKAVKVLGQLDEQAMVIHVESIESAEG